MFYILAFSRLVSFVGCGQQTPESVEGRAAAKEQTLGPVHPLRASSLVEPLDGSTVASPVSIVFRVENVELGAVPEEVRSSSPRLSIDSRLVEVVTPREDIVHHHLGIDTECLPPGTIVPQADPWIHFGDASSQVELLLPPGEHALVLQAGDDEHRTIRGVCTTTTITVTEG